MIQIKQIEINGVPIIVGDDGRIIREPYGTMSKRGISFGSTESKGYQRIQIKGQAKKVHRLVAQAFLSDYEDGVPVDHINGVHADNRVENLRMSSHSQNRRAFVKKDGSASCRYRGVSKKGDNRRSFAVTSIVDGSPKYIGGYPSGEEAAIRFDRSASENGYFPEALNRNNFPELAMLSGAY